MRGALLGVVETLVLGDEHVERSLGHFLGGPVFGQPGLERLAGDLLEPDRSLEHLGHDLRMSLKERSLGPRTGTLPCPLQERSISSLAAMTAMSRVARVGSLRSPEIGEKNTPCFLIGSSWRRTLSMNEGIVSAR
jgi:hypothetical protein